jgi:hypothetical protein
VLAALQLAITTALLFNSCVGLFARVGTPTGNVIETQEHAGNSREW